MDPRHPHDLRSNIIGQRQESAQDLPKVSPRRAAQLYLRLTGHYQPGLDSVPLVYYVQLFYQSFFIPVVIGGMAVYVLLDFTRTMIDRRRAAAAAPAKEGKETKTTEDAMSRIVRAWVPGEMGFRQKLTFVRFEPGQRLEHLVTLSSTAILALTGLPQKFHEADISRWLILAMGALILSVISIISSPFSWPWAPSITSWPWAMAS